MKATWIAAIRATAMMAIFAVCWPLAAQASEITAVSLQKSATGDVLGIRSDGELDYQSFDLSSPPRLVLTFPGSTLGSEVTGIDGGDSGVANVSTSVTKTGVRMDITLSRALGYKVEQQDNMLQFRFSALDPAKEKVADEAAVLKDIVITDRGEVTELVVRGEHMNASHDAFVTNHGQTLIMDFWGAVSKLPKEHYAAATRKVQSVTVGEAKGRVRLVVKLLPGVSDKHQIDATAGQMVVRFGSGVTASRKAAEVVVDDVQFKPNDRVAQMVIRTSVSNPVVSMHEEKGVAVLDIRKAVLAKGQERSQDVSEFPGPLRQIDAYRVGDKVRIVARLRDKVEISSFQQGNVLTVTFVPKDIAAAKRGVAKGDAFEYTGQKVSFDYQGIDIRNALRLIAEMSDMNIIMGDDVQGKLTMRLENVPWDQALDIILASQGLGKEVKGTVMRIAPLPVLTKEHQTHMEARQSEVELAPLITEFISLSYAKADEVKTMLESVQSADSTTTGGTATKGSEGAASSGMLTSRGSFVVDDRTNTLIVKDTAESINNIKRLIARIDKPVKQVLIEARIVEATDNFTRQLGVSWGGNFNSGRQANGGGSAIQIGGGNVAAGATAGRGFLVDLPAAGAAPGAASFGGTIGASIGAVNKVLNLDLELSAAESDGLVKIISNPRILAANGQSATISQGTEIPYVTPGTANTPPTTEFKSAELKLDVTPQIAPDNSINLLVDISKDAPDQQLGVVVIATKKIKTSLQVQSGNTIVIGGIYTQDKRANEGGIPLLKDIPLLGHLFKRTETIKNRSELLIFLTPSIINSSPVMSERGV